jgi:hypothetical protein
MKKRKLEEPVWKKNWVPRQKSKHKVTIGTYNSTSRYILKRNEMHTHTKTEIQMFIVALFQTAKSG